MYSRNSYRHRGGGGKQKKNYGRGRSQGRQGGGRGRRGQDIDVSKLINKATKQEEEVYVPQYAFSDFAISDSLKANIAQKGFNQPMPIQDKAIPHLLSGKDLIGIANTGTGKTLAFLIPLVEKALKQRGKKCLIITPTRELANQINSELLPLTKGLGIFSVTVIGGVNIRKQISDLRRPYNFLIGTPGRLKDLEERSVISFGQFESVVLDEVDRMFDMGFGPEIKKILEKTPKTRHSLFFSATVDEKIEALIQQYSRDPLTISVKSQDTASSVDQDVIRVGGRNKIQILEEVLRGGDVQKALIFGRTKFGVNKLSDSLRAKGFKAGAIHGNKSQHQRQRELKDFKEGQINILVATDVAARGLDIPNVTHVINFDMPETYEDYIHRIGRTGRGNAVGKALTFVG